MRERCFRPIGYIYTDFPCKFGIPRQSGIIDELKGKIIFEPEFRQVQAFRGLEEFSHIWVLWGFSESKRENWAATVTPPRLGGRKRMGVFATRAPYRPNNVGLSCVRLEKIEITQEYGPVVNVAGIDMVSGTPVYDIKPYIVYTDCHPDAAQGYVRDTIKHRLSVVFPRELLEVLPEEKRDAAVKVLEQDPRPAYDTDETRLYGVEFAGYDVRFRVAGSILTVYEVEKLTQRESGL